MEFKINKKLILIFITCIICNFGFYGNDKPIIVASTSWTGAFAAMAGGENIKVIAPVNLIHPPEYEITVSDVKAIANCDFFIYAGFERMMKTLGEKSGARENIKIKCDNSIETVRESGRKIAEALGTVSIFEKNFSKYLEVLENGRNQINKKGLKGARVLCNKNQVFLAKELGFTIEGIFGPGELSSKDIQKCKNGDYDFIIDNVHNPVGQVLSQVNEDSKYIVWRNFPMDVTENSLIKMVQNNIDKIFK